MKKKIVALALAVATVCSVTACGEKKEKQEGKELEKITFVLDWTPNTNHTGLYVAEEKGYFEDAGVDVEIVQPPEDGASALVASGKAQFGIDFQDSIAPAFASDDPLPVTAVATLIQHNTSGIISRKGEGMDRPKGMEGKTYATWDMEVEKAMIKNVVESDGGDYGKINMIPSNVTDEVTALKSKQVDAIWVYYAWGGIATEVKNLPTDYFAFKDINPVFDYYTPVIVANNDFLEEKPDTAKAFLSAVKKGYEDAIADPKEAADILCEAAPELDKELVLASQEWLADQYKAEVEQWGYIDPARWDAFYKWLGDNELIEQEIPAGFGFSNDYLESRMSSMIRLETKQVSKSFDGKKVIEDISISLQKNEIVSLLGVSGAGKTTLFNVISGLMEPDSGEVLLNGKEITGQAGHISYMLQKDLLLPYKTIEENVALPLMIKGEKKKDALAKVRPQFGPFGLAGTEKKYPSQLSGGMRQRAALLRTYLFSEGVALLDEPFSALDTITKSAMHKWYLDIMNQIELSTIFITHDIDEAILLSDRIFLMTGKPGRITKEIVIREKKPRGGEFNLTEAFLNYKREIITQLGVE